MNSTSGYQPTSSASVIGCEPPAHSAQRLITQITGFKCTHLHPALIAHDEPAKACAYVGPHMVEPLALQIHVSSGPSVAAAAAAAVPIDEPLDERIPNPSQYVLTCYYLAWLTQSRFEQRAATLPLANTGAASLPLAEVTWFKMDTAAQVLSHASDKLALREAIHRLSRNAAPQPPFAYSSALLSNESSSEAATPADQAKEGGENEAEEDISSSAESSAGFSDAATKTMTACVTPARASSPSGRNNLDILRKTATSLSKRGGLLIRSGRNSAKDSGDNSEEQPTAPTQPTPQELVVRAKPHIPRVLSIFYKLVGSSN
ncbi:hypothetical protein GGI21_005971 [Coemansia aciculifera]|nr:hypothetical protein GGI21_005971 [Coemansia aciculifera]